MTVRKSAIILLSAVITSWNVLAAEGWETDWAKAKAIAARDNRTILMDFTGSDWCVWCVKLNEEVFDTDVFKSYSAANLVLMEVDFPHQEKQSFWLKMQNRNLQQKFGKTGFPTVYLTDAQGRPFASTGYLAGGATAYVDHLKELMKVRTQRDQALAKAERVQGFERAKILVEALAPLPIAMLKFYGEQIKEIQALDKDNRTGFMDRFQEMQVVALKETVYSLVTSGKNAKALAKVNAFIADHPISGELKQKALMLKLTVFSTRTLADVVSAEAVVDEIIGIDANTATAKECQEIKASLIQIKKLLEAMKEK